jgi:hypothetical protein
MNWAADEFLCHGPIVSYARAEFSACAVLPDRQAAIDASHAKTGARSRHVLRECARSSETRRNSLKFALFLSVDQPSGVK